MWVAAAATWAAIVLLVGGVHLSPEDGDGVLVTLAVPLILVAGFAFVVYLWRPRRRTTIAWWLVVLAGAFCLLSILTVGLWFLPVPCLLAFACGRLEREAGLRSPAP